MNHPFPYLTAVCITCALVASLCTSALADAQPIANLQKSCDLCGTNACTKAATVAPIP